MFHIGYCLQISSKYAPIVASLRVFDCICDAKMIESWVDVETGHISFRMFACLERDDFQSYRRPQVVNTHFNLYDRRLTCFYSNSQLTNYLLLPCLSLSRYLIPGFDQHIASVKFQSMEYFSPALTKRQAKVSKHISLFPIPLSNLL